MFQQSETGDGARVVLKFWPNFRLAVLIKVVLITKERVKEDKRCKRNQIGEIHISFRYMIYKKIVIKIRLVIL